MNLRRFLVLRRRASVLLYYVAKAIEAKRGREAWSIYREWVRGRLGFREALEKLRELEEQS